VKAALPDQIILNPQAQAKGPPEPSSRKGAAPAKPGEMKDGTREIIETIVFVVVLVLLLKTFLAEAFVIPTGSMADTLLGYHRNVTCDKCGYPFRVNASSEEDPQDGQKLIVVRCYCPNCRYFNFLPRR
jgi:signal peptidase I